MEETEKLGKIFENSDCYAAIVFGSYARGENYRDIDVAVFTDSDIRDIVREAPAIFDIQRFSDMPMYVRHRVLDEGELFYCRDQDRFYDEVFRFVKEYEDFRPRYEDYLEGVKSRG